MGDVEDGGLARTLKDLFAGAVGGVAQVLIGKTPRPWSVIDELQLTHSQASHSVCRRNLLTLPSIS